MEAEATTETTMAHTKKKSQKQNKTKKLKNTKNQNKKKSKSICSFIYSEWTQPITDWHGTRYVPDA